MANAHLMWNALKFVGSAYYITLNFIKNIFGLPNTRSNFEPVNTLRLKLGNRPIVQDGWETELNQRYLKLKQSSAQLAQKERDK